MKFTRTLLAAALIATTSVVSAFAQENSQPQWTPLYEGVDVANYEVAQPLMKVVAARIDLKAPGIKFKTTAPNPDFKKDERETYRRTTAEFLKDQGLSVAVNANFYNPFNGKTIATEGDSNLIGMGVSDGFIESEPQNGFPSFVVKKDGSVDIKQYSVEDDLSDIQQAVSGNMIVLKDGEIPEFSDAAVHPRTAVGFSEDKRYVYFMTIDGRQKGFSVGATYAQVGKELQNLGAYQGLNLDGGGSTTFVVRDSQGEPVVLNRPCNGTPDKLRHNANGVGVKANGAPKTDPKELSNY